MSKFKNEDRELTGVFDITGKEIRNGDILQLDFETIHPKGEVIKKDEEWVLFQDDHNYVGVAHNKQRVKIIGNAYPEL